MLIFMIATLFLFAIYAGLLITFSFGFDRNPKTASNATPSVTVIVSARNEAKNMPVLIKSLAAQRYPKKKTEIVLVDDRSDDETFRIMKQAALKYPHFKILKIHAKPAGISPKKNAIETAIRQSRGEIILTTDADARPGPDWINKIVETFDPETGAVIGYAPYRTDKPYGSFFHKLLALEYFSLASVSLSSVGMNYPTTCNGANFAYRREVFHSIGGFGETRRFLSGDDDLFLHRIRAKTRYRIRYSVHPEAAVPNNPPDHFKSFLWQRIRFSSKHLAYPRSMVAALSFVYGLNVALLIGLIGSFFSLDILKFFLLILLLKSLFELPFLFRARRLLEKRKLLKYYPLAVFPHIIYVALLPLLGQIIKPRWK